MLPTDEWISRDILVASATCRRNEGHPQSDRESRLHDRG
jgi:hypothetical protein